MDETIADPEIEEVVIKEYVDDLTDQDTTKTQLLPLFRIPQTKQKRRLTKLAKVECAIEKLREITENRPLTSSNVQADEVDVFGKYVAAQLKELHLKNQLACQEKI